MKLITTRLQKDGEVLPVLQRAATLLEEIARLTTNQRGQLWRGVGIDATKAARDLRRVAVDVAPAEEGA